MDALFVKAIVKSSRCWRFGIAYGEYDERRERRGRGDAKSRKGKKEEKGKWADVFPFTKIDSCDLASRQPQIPISMSMTFLNTHKYENVLIFVSPLEFLALRP